MKHLIIRS